MVEVDCTFINSTLELRTLHKLNEMFKLLTMFPNVLRPMIQQHQQYVVSKEVK